MTHWWIKFGGISVNHLLSHCVPLLHDFHLHSQRKNVVFYILYLFLLWSDHCSLEIMGGFLWGTFLKLELAISQKRFFPPSSRGGGGGSSDGCCSMMMCCSRAQNSFDTECTKRGELSQRAGTGQCFVMKPWWKKFLFLSLKKFSLGCLVIICSKCDFIRGPGLINKWSSSGKALKMAQQCPCSCLSCDYKTLIDN